MVSNSEWALKAALRMATSEVNCLWDMEDAHIFHIHSTTGFYKRLYMERLYNNCDMLAVNVNGCKFF